MGATEVAPPRAGARAFSSKSVVVSEGEKSKVAAEGGEESTRLRAETTEGVGTGRDPSKGGSAGPTAAMVRGALLLEPVEEKN